MVIGGIVGAVVLAALTVVLLTRRAAHDDLHSVEGYHRSIHTLESINAHPAAPGRAAAEPSLFEKSAYPESALRLAGTHSVRVTDAPPSSVPPVPPPPAADAEIPVTFDDFDLSTPPPPPPPPTLPTSPTSPTPPMPLHDAPGSRDKAMGAINHRPRRLAAPGMAVAVVIVLVVVLLLAGSHKVVPPRHHHGGSTETNVTTPTPKPQGKSPAQSTTTLPPAVSLPQSSTALAATYDVSGRNFPLTFAATSGACWVDATNSTSGATLFAGTLQPGAQQSLNATGPVTVVIGAPTVLAVSVDGSQVALPTGFQTPFTMRFVTAS